MPTVLGVFDSEEPAQQAISRMKENGISEERISLVAKRDEGQDMEAGGEMRGEEQDLADGTVTGGALGGIGGILAGAGLLAVPGVGPILAAGPLAAGLSGVAAGGIAGALVDYGVDEDTGERYAQEVEQGRILVAAEETDENRVSEVANILRENGAYDVEQH
ncbi:general stress protein [Natroniella acetigena]|uniref:general stress protein n=1 Tax=Natroniella acetigena TaxID=52004 RepID=UPI00200A33F6|nr:general stress protein [Natroniella acetigena]MCK8826251.1 general stress protein [Natroniella acetigena]